MSIQASRHVSRSYCRCCVQVEEVYLKPLLAELAGQQQPSQAADEEALVAEK